MVLVILRVGDDVDVVVMVVPMVVDVLTAARGVVEVGRVEDHDVLNVSLR